MFIDTQTLAAQLLAIDPTRFAALCNDLLVQNAIRLGIPRDHLALNLSITDPDGGIDARCVNAPAIGGRLLPRANCAYQFKSGHTQKTAGRLAKEPNFHWGFMAGGYAWTKTPLPVEKYCAYWIKEIGATRELNRSEWDKYWAKLETAGIVEAAGKEAFDAEFTRSQRQKAHPRPGLFCKYMWSLAETQRFDAQGKIIEKVRVRLNQMLTALNAPKVPAHGGIQ